MRTAVAAAVVDSAAVQPSLAAAVAVLIYSDLYWQHANFAILNCFHN